MKVLVTGASGFAGSWLVRACALGGDDVVGVARRPPAPTSPASGVEHCTVDLRDAEAVRALVRKLDPHVIYHLAALSSVGRAWQEPERTLSDNVTTAVNVLEAVRHEAPTARVVWVSSCEVYGPPSELPVTEDAPVKPANPYAVSKTAGDLLAGVYADAYSLDLVRARPFNHAGPGQGDTFIVSSLSKQAAEARVSGVDEVEIVTGNPDTRRDFTDVRDVVRAYRLLAERGDRAVYNVSSGQSVSAAEQVQLLTDVIAPIQVRHRVDPARVRPHEVMELRGSHDRLSAATGWEPVVAFRQTVSDTVEWWEQQLTAAPA